MEKHTIDFDLFGSDNYEVVEARRSRAEQNGAKYTCQMCGRKVNPERGWMVQVVDGGMAIALPGTGDQNDSGYMGWWDLGPECGKHVPRQFRSKIK